MGKIIDAKTRLEKMEIWNKLSHRTKEHFATIMEEATEEAKEFYHAEIIGNCPRCGSEKVRDCEEVIDMEDNTVGFCLDCGFLWCLECEYELTDNICSHWTVCDDCEKVDEDGMWCPYEEDLSECPSVKNFMERGSESFDLKGGEPF